MSTPEPIVPLATSYVLSGVEVPAPGRSLPVYADTPQPAPETAGSSPAEDTVVASAESATVASPKRSRRVGMPRWPMLLLAAPAGVATWSGWVGLGTMAGFGMVKPLPGISDWQINSAITLPIGVEAYGAYALGAWLSGRSMSAGTRRFAAVSAVGSLLLGMAGQITYHLLQTEGWKDHAPVPVVMFVSALPVLVLGLGAALWHMISHDQDAAELSATDNDAVLDGETDSLDPRRGDSADSGPRTARDSHGDSSEDTEDRANEDTPPVSAGAVLSVVPAAEDTDRDSRTARPGAVPRTGTGRTDRRPRTARPVPARDRRSVPAIDKDRDAIVRDVAARCEREGRPLSRSALREAGVTGSNATLSALIAEIAAERDAKGDA